MIESVFFWRRSHACGLGILLRATALAALGVTLGCAVPGGGVRTGLSPEALRAAVTERVNARWAALIKGDVDAAYMFLSPASREVVSREAYKSRTGARGYRAVAVDGVQCEAEVCRVSLMLTYDHRLMKGITTPLSETWVIDQGQAWYVWQR